MRSSPAISHVDMEQISNVSEAVSAAIVREWLICDRNVGNKFHIADRQGRVYTVSSLESFRLWMSAAAISDGFD
jgi:hypothetical protein